MSCGQSFRICDFLKEECSEADINDLLCDLLFLLVLSYRGPDFRALILLGTGFAAAKVTKSSRPSETYLINPKTF